MGSTFSQGVGSREHPVASLSMQDFYVKVATSRTLDRGGHESVFPNVSMNKAQQSSLEVLIRRGEDSSICKLRSP